MVEYVGLDVSKEATSFCVKGEDGVVLARGKVPTDPDALFEALKAHCLCPERIVLETGTLSGWLARELGQKLGVVGIRLVVLKTHHRVRLTRVDHIDREPQPAELARQPTRKRPPLGKRMPNVAKRPRIVFSVSRRWRTR